MALGHLIGTVVRSHRKAGGLTQQQLADLAGVGRSSIYEIERGNDSVQMNTLLAVLRVLSISLQVDAPLLEETHKKAEVGEE